MSIWAGLVSHLLGTCFGGHLAHSPARADLTTLLGLGLPPGRSLRSGLPRPRLGANSYAGVSPAAASGWPVAESSRT
jgi:hypothetical protein